jgi:alpha-beta hydrolase superfamily lysophospholipase
MNRTSSRDLDAPTVRARDGLTLACHRWSEPGLHAEPDRVLVFLHGIGAYGSFYGHVAEGLLGAVDHVYMPDLRGHGYSGGARGALGSRPLLISDLHAIITYVREHHEAARIYLGGESLGALIALGYAEEHATEIDGLVLVAPALRLQARALTSGPSAPPGAPAGPLVFLREGVQVQGPVPGENPRHPHFRAKCVADERMLQRVSLNHLAVARAFQRRWVSIARGLTLPVLVVRGGSDRLLDGRAADALCDLLPHAATITLPGAWHNVFWDPQSQGAIDCIADWLSKGAVCPPRLCAYRHDPLHAWIRSRSLGALQLFLGYATVLIGTKVLLTGVLGTLSSPGLGALHRADQTVLPWLKWFIGPISSALTSAGTATGVSDLIAQRAAVGPYGALAVASSTIGAVPMPYGRDYIEILAMLALSAYLATQHLHWRAISDAPNDLIKNGVVDGNVVSEQRTRQLIDAADTAMNAGWNTWVSLAIAIASALLLYATISAAGMYASLWPGVGMDVARWQHAVFEGWWANPAIGGWGSLLVYLGVDTLCLYYVVRGNFVGGHSVSLLRSFLDERSCDPEFPGDSLELRPEHADGVAGLKPLRTVLGYAIGATGLLLAVFVSLTLYMPLAVGIWAAPFLAMALLVSPILVTRPISVINGLMRDYRTSRTSDVAKSMLETREALDAACALGSTASCRIESIRLEALRYDYSLAVGMPVSIFSVRVFAVGAALYAVPLLLLLLEVLPK